LAVAEHLRGRALLGIRPCCSTMMRSETASITARSWLMNSDAKPSSACSCTNSSSTFACTDTSSAGGLVGDEQLRVQRQRPGERGALTLAAGQLVRVAVAEVRRQPHRVEQLVDAVRAAATLAPGRARPAARRCTRRSSAAG
jgi:hypothetical protein